jgi:WD40 repeat protein
MPRRGVGPALIPLIAILSGLLHGCGDDKGTTGSSAPAGAANTGAAVEAPRGPPLIEPARFLTGHMDGVHAVAFSPDGKQLATASHDGTARVWDAASGNEVKLLQGHTGAVYSVAFSPDGQRVATAGHDGLVLVWDVRSGELLSMLEGHQHAVLTVGFTPDGDVVSGGQDTTARRWNPSEEKEVLRVRADALAVVCSAVTADGTLLATAGKSGYVAVWDLASGSPVWRDRVPRNDSEENDLRAGQGQEPSFGSDPTATGADVEGRPPAVVTGVTFSPDGSRLFTRTHYGAIQEWGAKTGRHVRHLEPFAPAMAMALTRDGTWIFIADNAGPRIWKLDANPMVLIANLGISNVADAHEVAFSPDGRLAALARGGGWRDGSVWHRDGDNRVVLWDLSQLGPGAATAPATAPATPAAAAK